MIRKCNNGINVEAWDCDEYIVSAFGNLFQFSFPNRQ